MLLYLNLKTILKSCYLLIAVLTSLSTMSQTITIYVSPNGAATGNGADESAPVSLARARLVAKANPNQPCVIWLADGIYTNRIVLDATDTRLATAPITYKAQHPLKAIFQLVTNINRSLFQPIPDSIKTRIIDSSAKTKVVQLNLSAFNLKNMNVWPGVFESGTINWPRFYNNLMPLPMSQYPNDTGLMRMKTVLSNGSSRSVPGGSFKYRDDRCKYWDKALTKGLWLKGNWRVSWQITYIKTQSINTVDSTIVQAIGVSNGIGDKYTRPAGNGKEPYVAVNLLEEIDKEGEWAIDFSTKMLYMWPPQSGELSVADDFTQTPIALNGVSNVNIENMAILSGVGGGVSINACNNVTVAGMDISYCSGDAITLTGGTNCIVKSNNLYELGSGGIIVAPKSASALYANLLTLTPCNHQIINNHIYNFAKEVAVYSAGINLKTVIGAYVANNKIHGTPHVGILYDGNNNVLEYNELYDIILKYDDMGAFYRATGPKSRGNKIRQNYVHDSPLSKGTFYDNGSQGDSSSYNIDANNLYAFGNNGGYFTTYTNSIIVNDKPGASINVTSDTAASFKPFYDTLVSIYNASSIYRAAYPELADMVGSASINKTYTSRIWPRYTCNVLISNSAAMSGIADASLFKTNGTINTTYAIKAPFTTYKTVVANSLKMTGKLTKPIRYFSIDSLKTTGAFAKTCQTNWHINRLGLYNDSFRTDAAVQLIPGIAPLVTVAASSNNNFVAPTVVTLSVKAKNPNIANCINSVQFYDNGSPIIGLTPSVLSSNFDSVTYTANWTGAPQGDHSITATILDAPNWTYHSFDSVPFTITAPLPLQLLSFSGQAKNCRTELQWNTSNEIHMAGFVLESSNDGNRFEVIDTLLAKCNNAIVPCNYRANVPQSNPAYYRLKMLDVNGQYAYSKSIYVAANCNTQPLLQFYPNPASDKVMLQFLNEGAIQNAGVQVCTLEGKVLITQPVSLVKGRNYFAINTSKLAPGLYVVKFNNAIVPLNAKLVIVR